MTVPSHPYWKRQFDTLVAEISRLCLACDIKFLEPGIGERVLKGDDSVCGHRDPQAFEKLRMHLMAYCRVEEKAVGRLGADDVRPMLDDIRNSLARLRGET